MPEFISTALVCALRDFRIHSPSKEVFATLAASADHRGVIETTDTELARRSWRPVEDMAGALRNLVKYGYITLQESSYPDVVLCTIVPIEAVIPCQ